MISFHRHEYRGDYEVRDSSGKCRGFIWQHEGRWVCSIGDQPAQYPGSFDAANELARELLADPAEAPKEGPVTTIGGRPWQMSVLFRLCYFSGYQMM